MQIFVKTLSGKIITLDMGVIETNIMVYSSILKVGLFRNVKNYSGKRNIVLIFTKINLF